MDCLMCNRFRTGHSPGWSALPLLPHTHTIIHPLPLLQVPILILQLVPQRLCRPIHSILPGHYLRRKTMFMRSIGMDPMEEECRHDVSVSTCICEGEGC